MATPQWVRFSPIARTIEQICNRDLTGVFSEYSFRLWVINELGIKEDTQTLGDIDAPFIECADIEAALRSAEAWRGVALTFVVDAIGHNITINLWREHEKTILCLYLAREIMWYRSDDYDEGEWLLKFLLRFITALKADCCGYGRDWDYDVIYAPLDADRVLLRLRDRSLFSIPSPVIHLISSGLISYDEINSVIAAHDVPVGFRYRQNTTGYHMLWNFR